jgi:predicted DNA-binding protein (UPF0251 family)
MARPLIPRWINFDTQSYSFMTQLMLPLVVNRLLLPIEELEALRPVDLGGRSRITY